MACLLGHNIFREVGRSVSGGLPGVRYRVACAEPLHCDPRIRCRKSREGGLRQTAAYGPQEPLAYLGAWLTRASHYQDRDAHVRYNPTPKDVREFVHTNGLPEFLEKP